MSAPEWDGDWVSRELGIELVPDDGEDPRDLVGLALRHNPKRDHLLVSAVLGKHLPAPPETVIAAGRRLGELVDAQLGDTQEPPVVVGYAETATGLGHVVADVLCADYLHSTRRCPSKDDRDGTTFEEEHSHATSHVLMPSDPMLLHRDGSLVLVDDEVSTGRTALNTVVALQRLHPRKHYVLATLVDARDDEARAAAAAVAGELGVRIDAVSLASMQIRSAGPPSQRATALLAEPAPKVMAQSTAQGTVVRATVNWTAGLPLGGRHGFLDVHRAAFDRAILRARDSLSPFLLKELRGSVHVLGTEELMYLPLRIADALQAQLEVPVTFSTTTRSPVVVVDEPGYAIRHGLSFPPHDSPSDAEPRFVYNLPDGRFGSVVLVLDSEGDTPATAELVNQLSGVTHYVLVVTMRESGALAL